MMRRRVFVCSPLRGANGQPAPENIALARLLMKAVFDAGHAPFVPHLLYPQVLSESSEDLEKAFAANMLYLDSSDECWVYAYEVAGCSKGMRLEVEHVQEANAMFKQHGIKPTPLLFMPEPFVRVQRELAANLAKGHEMLLQTTHVGTCTRCGQMNGLNSQGICLKCFAGGTPT